MNSRVAINIVFFLNGFLFVSWAARMPLIQEIYSLAYDQLGYLLLSSSIGSVLAMPLTGFLIQKFGSRSITILAGFSYYFSVALFPWMGTYITLIFAFFYMGASVGMLDVSMNGQAVEVEKRWKKPIMSFFHAMFSIGMMLGSFSVSFIEKATISLWVHLLSIAIIASIIMFFIIRYMVDEEDIENEAVASFTMPKGPVIILGLIAFCCMLGEGAMAEWSTNYMLEVSNSSIFLAPIGLFAFSSAMTIGRLFGDKARTKYGDSALLTVGGLISSLGLIIAITLPYPFLTITSLFIVGLGLATIVPIVYSLAGNLPGIKPGVGISMATTIGYSGFLFGPPIIGLLAETYGLRWSWIFVLILFLLIIPLVKWNERKKYS